MDAPLYDIYLTGKLADGVSADQAGARLAQLFKSSPEAMAGLLTGKPQVLKRGVDKATALKYREALSRAGVEVAFKEAAAKDPAPRAAAVTAEKPISAAPTTAPATAPTPAAAATNGLTIAPAGADVLKPEERQQVLAIAVDTSHLSVAPLGNLGGDATAPPVAAPDTSHLTLAAAGADLLAEAERRQPPVAVPEAGDWSLAPAGAVIETLHQTLPPVNPDTSGLTLAPEGTDLLPAEQRNKPAPPPPNTDHLRVVDNPS